METVQNLRREAFTRSSIVQTFSIPANSTVPISQYGQSFYFIAATAPLEVKTDVTAFKPYRKGTGEEFTDEMRFQRLEVKNSNAFNVTISIWVGFGKYLDNRFEVLDSYTGIRTANAPGTIAAGATLALNGSPTGTQIQRKALVVSNIDTAAILQVLDLNNALCCAIFPQTSITLPISGEVRIKNPTGVIAAVYVSEIWYYENQI